MASTNAAAKRARIGMNYLPSHACRSSGGLHFTAAYPLVPHSCVLRAGAAPPNCVPPPGATPAPPPVPLRPRIARAARSRPAEAQPRGSSHAQPPARPAAAAAARAPRPHSRSKAPCRCPPPACASARSRSSSFTCPGVRRTRPPSLRRRPRGGAARPPCAASRGRKLELDRN